MTLLGSWNYLIVFFKYVILGTIKVINMPFHTLFFGTNMSISEPDGALGLKIVTEIVVTKGGVNYDDLLIGRTCRHCSKLMLNGSVTDIRGHNSFKIVIKAPDGLYTEMHGSEILSVACQCGAFYSIVFFEPIDYYDSGVVAYTIIELDGTKHKLADRLKEMKDQGETPPDMGEWVIDALADGFNRAVRVVNEDGITLVEEDWLDSKYSTGWIEE